MLVAAMIAAALRAAPLDCGAPLDAGVATAGLDARFIVIGEIHGTTEVPAAFGDWICETSADRPVVVGLEYEDSAQSAFDAWMTSPGTDADRRALLASTAFTRRFEDGRSSRAMMDLLEKLRSLKASGRDLSVVAFRPSVPPAEGFDQNYGELAMAQSLAAMAQRRPDALVMVLVGRFHASQQPVGPLRPAFAHLPDKDVLSIALEPQGGSMWSCGGDGPTPQCGDKSIGGTDSGQRGVRFNSEPGPFDGWLSLGPTTFSPPAHEGERD